MTNDRSTMKRWLLITAIGATAAGCLAVASYVSGCGSTAILPVSDSTHVARASQRWRGTTAAELEKGRSAYKDRCSGCHSVYAPSELSEAEWNKILPIMHRKARSEDQERIWIDKYILIHAGTLHVERSAASPPEQ